MKLEKVYLYEDDQFIRSFWMTDLQIVHFKGYLTTEDNKYKITLKNYKSLIGMK